MKPNKNKINFLDSHGAIGNKDSQTSITYNIQHTDDMYL